MGDKQRSVREEMDCHRRAGALTQLGIDLYNHCRYAPALNALDKALALVPDYVRALRGQALCLSQLGRAPEALEFAERAVALAPTDGLAFATLGLTLHRLGRWPEAEEAFEHGLELTPDDHRVYYNYACYWAERGHEEHSRKYLALACDLAPETFAAVIAGDPDLARYAAAPWFRDLLASLKTRSAQ